MPGNTTAGSTLLDEELRRILQEREQECLQLQTMNSTPPPGMFEIHAMHNINIINILNFCLCEFD